MLVMGLGLWIWGGGWWGMIDLFQICFAICVVVRYMVIMEIWNRRDGMNQSIMYVAGIDSLLIDT